jgi:hypothetical protein
MKFMTLTYVVSGAFLLLNWSAHADQLGSVAPSSAATSPTTHEAAPAMDHASEPRLPLLNVITDIPDTAWLGLKHAFSQDALSGWAIVLGSTAVLYHYDPDILSGVQRTGRDWGLGNSVRYKSVLNIGSLTLFSAPRDTAGWLYFMGDGTIPVVASVAMLGVGYEQSNGRLYNTGIEMANGLLTGSIFDQLLKHVAGRESPSAATEPRGAWHPFANLKTYSANTSKYDAMASGHIMTATVMFTVVEQNYPEYNCVLYPFEGVWLAALGVGMINVGVHWASDYPLGIAMGYVFGKAAVDLHRRQGKPAVAQNNWNFFPGVDPATGETTFNALRFF